MGQLLLVHMYIECFLWWELVVERERNSIGYGYVKSHVLMNLNVYTLKSHAPPQDM